MFRYAKLSRVAMLALVLLVASGCGEDGSMGPQGDPGRSFIAVIWVGTPLSFGADDPAFPAVVFSNTYYESSEGTYGFGYVAWDGSSWIGNYTIEIQEGLPGGPGEEGGFFPWESGSDGEKGLPGGNLYYVLGLFSIGPSFSVSTRPRLPSSGEAEEVTVGAVDVAVGGNMRGLEPVRRVVQDLSGPGFSIHLEADQYRSGTAPNVGLEEQRQLREIERGYRSSD